MDAVTRIEGKTLIFTEDVLLCLKVGIRAFVIAEMGASTNTSANSIFRNLRRLDFICGFVL